MPKQRWIFIPGALNRRQMFYYWHVLHKPFAIVMYVFMFVHILVAVFTGYGFGGGH